MSCVATLAKDARVGGSGGCCVAWWRDESCARLPDGGGSGGGVSQEALGHGRACCFGNKTAGEKLGLQVDV
jgi:hypothetical protein